MTTTSVHFPEQHWCRKHGVPCTSATIWNECKHTACIRNEPYSSTPVIKIKKEKKMTNREWLESLSDKEFADMIAYENCARTCAYYHNNHCGHKSCESGIEEWLKQEYEPPKKELSQAQLCEAFELKFGKRRAITLDEVREVTKEIFK